jgi:predicted nuclease of restriction endonuclease-like RecB superfamily
MLPSTLLRTQKRKNTIKPILAQLTKENLEVANLLIQTYKENLGRKKRELDEAIENLNELEYDYRFVRGLTTLLDRRCKLSPKTPIESSKIRRLIFTLTQRDGLPTTNQARKTILTKAAKDLHLPSENIEDYLYADLQDQQIIESLEEISSENLLKWYNLSLTQTLLFCATELCFTTTGNWQEIFKKIKWLGLIYEIQRIDNVFMVTVDGPASLFKLNRKYGTSLAKILPSIIANKKWRITAKILRYKRDTQLLNLQMDSTQYREILMSQESSEPKYDSLVEKDFANRFGALATGWNITREPEPIPVGKWVMIPDFKLQKGKISIYLEIAGFWTPKYLENKIKKLSLLDNVNFIVAANKKLECQKLKKIGNKINLFFYEKRIPLKTLLENSLINFYTLAKKFDVLEESIKKFLENKEISGYVNLGDSLISNTKVREIEKKLNDKLEKKEVNYAEAVKLIEGSGGKNPIKILEILNFGVKWHGIDPESARIYKNESRKVTKMHSN